MGLFKYLTTQSYTFLLIVFNCSWVSMFWIAVYCYLHSSPNYGQYNTIASPHSVWNADFLETTSIDGNNICKTKKTAYLVETIQCNLKHRSIFRANNVLLHRLSLSQWWIYRMFLQKSRECTIFSCEQFSWDEAKKCCLHSFLVRGQTQIRSL